MVSIIIPIYNQERYLRKCVNSCLNQTYRDIEIILVNDASTDRSLEICEAYLKQDSRIRLVNKKMNEGLEKARRSGLHEAKGDYVFFVDSDDWLCNKDCIQKLMTASLKTDSDYVEIGMKRSFDSFGLVSRKSKPAIIGILTQPKLFEEYYLSFFGKNLLSVNTWGKLYKRDILNPAVLPLGITMAEDEALNLRIFPHLKRICILSDIGYAYRWGGMTTKYNPHFYPDMLKFYKFRRNFLIEHPHPAALDYLKIELKNVLLTQIEMMLTYKTMPQEEIIDWIHQEISSEVYSDIPHLTNPGHSHLIHQPDMVTIANKDAKGVYGIAYDRFSKSKKKRILKKILSKFF